MDCPRCGAATDERPECPRCGVVLAKARRSRERPPSAGAPPRIASSPAAGHRPRTGLLWTLVVVAMLGASVAVLRQRQARTARLTPTAPAVAAAPAIPSDPGAQEAAVPPPIITSSAPPVSLPDEATRLADARDADAAQRLARKLATGALMSGSDVAEAERLYGLYPEAARLLGVVLVKAAERARAGRDYSAAAAHLERALAVDPASAAVVRRLLLGVRVEQADWPAAERTAGELLRVLPGDSEAVQTLAYALLRQDRTREATDALASFLEGHQDPQVAALLARIRSSSAAEAPLQQQTLAHFHVRYDGEAHEDVGREILGVLDRHYATLVSTFDYQPAEAIPVVLLSREAYYDAAGVPVWSGGRYDSFDGRVRIPIGGLTASLSPELDATVVHELTHAFVADRSGGLAPRELQEGLAQYTEGRRSSSLDEPTLRALADGRMQNVHGYYLAALVFVEDLMGQRGQGGINDALAAMARSGNVDAAFHEVYGRSYQEALADALGRLRSRHGS